MSIAPKLDLAPYIAEIEQGLPTIKHALDCALENQAFYDHEGERYLPQREAESTFDFMGRPKRQSGVLRQGIEILTQHLYSPGPTRQFDDAAGEAFLEQVWTDNLYDGLLLHADILAHLNDVCAIQVDAGKGEFQTKPITLQLWGREEFHVWTDPDNALLPVAVVTIDRYNEQTRYRLWTDTEVRTFMTKKMGTSGGIVAEQVAQEDHQYGCMPFGFVHFDLPVRRFFTPGPGTFLRKAEVRVDDKLSLLDESISKHLNPVPVAENVPLEWNPIIEPQRFIRLFSGGPQLTSAGEYSGGDAARLYYLQAWIDTPGAWADVTNYIEQVFNSVGIPQASIRMEAFRVASGVALVAEQAPLLSRARKRRSLFGVFESKLAQTILLCAGNHYGKPALVSAAADGMLSLGWPEPTIPVPSPDRDNEDNNAMAIGIKSKLMVIQERYSCNREQALEILQQVAKDRIEEDAILPPPAPDPAPPAAGWQTANQSTDPNAEPSSTK